MFGANCCTICISPGFAWQKDHTCRKEEPLAKTGEHHVLSIAEAMKRSVTAEKDLNALRNYVFANFTAMRLYGRYAVGGKKPLEDCVDKLIKL